MFNSIFVFNDASSEPGGLTRYATHRAIRLFPRLFPRLIVGCGLACSVALTPAHAQLDGTRTIALINQAGEETVIGEVQFTPMDSQVNFNVDLDTPVFTDHFLSMRPFRCIEGPRDWACHLPYPYDTRRLVTHNDLIDLEYALLFIAKKPTEFGIDAWNGRYFRLTILDNKTIEGELHEVDLNLLASPPEGAFARPVGTKDLTLADPDSHPYPKLRIR